MRFKHLAAAVVTCAALAVTGSASAAPLASHITGGFNTFNDQSTDMVFDNGDGVVSDGDVFVGLLRIDDRTEGGTKSLNNQELYAVFALEVNNAQLVGSSITFDWIPSTVTGLTLADIVGPALPPQDRAGDALAAVFSDVGANYIGSQSMGTIGDSDGSGQFDGLDYIHSLSTDGTLELVLGFVAPGGPEDADFLIGSVGNGGVLGLLNSVGENTTIGMFEGGLSVLTNLTGKELLREVCTPGLEFPIGQVGAPCGFPGATKHDMTLSGTLNGLAASDVADDFFANGLPNNPGDNDFVTIGATDYQVYGAGNNARFRIAAVPEPASLAILGLGLLGLGFGRRLASRA